MIEISNTSNIPLPNNTQAYLDFSLHITGKILHKIITRPVEVVFVSSQTIQQLNAQYMHKDYATDVLSFPLDMNINVQNIDSKQQPLIPLGSIVINLDLAQTMSQKLNHSLIQEIMLLFVHALLHLLGFDHERDNGQHHILEQQILYELNMQDKNTTQESIVKGLIERNQK